MRHGGDIEEILVVGGGLAGTSAACALAQAGRPVLLIERDETPRHKVCGEFLSIEAQTYLTHMGVDLDALGASHISSVKLYHGRTSVEVDLPFTARGLSRKVLDETLLQRASLLGARLIRGPSVRTISTSGATIQANVADLGEIRAKTLFLATGKHDVRGAKRHSSGTRNDLIGFKAHYFLAEEQRNSLGGKVEVVLFAGGYAGLQLIEGGTANLCLVVTRHCFEMVGKSWQNLLEHIGRETPHLSDRLEGATSNFERPLSIFQIPYGYIHAPDPAEPQGLFRLGDQAGVIPSYTGDGMAIALHSGCLAASTYLGLAPSSSAFHTQLRNDISRQIRLASLFYEAGRRTAGQQAILQIFRAWPTAMRYVAALTRLRNDTVQRALIVS